LWVEYNYGKSVKQELGEDMASSEEIEQARVQIVEWNAKLQQARDAYYVNAAPIMSDVEYDKMERMLRRAVDLFPQFRELAPVVDTVGSDLEGTGDGRFRHLSSMLSIENAYTHDELLQWYDTICEELGLKSVRLELEPKVDGLSCGIHYDYRSGTPIQALTRGDGTFGEDVTAVVTEQGCFPRRCTFPKDWDAQTIEIRGEVAITHMEFERINKEAEAKGEKPYANCRNLASGTLKMKDPVAASLRKLIFIPWQVLIHKEGQRGQIALGPDATAALSHIGFRQYLGRSVLVTDEMSREEQHRLIVETLENVMKERDTLWTTGLGIDTDGIVIKVSDPKLRKKLTDSSKYQGSMRAWKAQSSIGVTTLEDVIWQTGRSGKLTPVGIVKPINLAGAIVSKCNLNNWTWMQEMGVTHLPCQVEILRSGEVIPVLTRVISS
jgi:DNA ligase (NAD+)